MLPRSWHLNAPSHFNLVYRRGHVKRYFGLIWREIRVLKLPNTKIAVVISKKVSPKATVRNLYKRRIWAILNENKQIIPKKEWLFVIQVAPLVLQCDYKKLEDSIKKALLGKM